MKSLRDRAGCCFLMRLFHWRRERRVTRELTDQERKARRELERKLNQKWRERS